MIVSFLVCISLTVALVSAVTFPLVCANYPDICDNHSNVMFCHGFTKALHYDAIQKDGAADKRRTAIGCGSNNYCSGTGLQCDEYPYASTYDGGLGCFPSGYTGKDALANQGGTRCADGSQNGRHGQAISTFYRSMLKNENGKAFLVGFKDDHRGPLGEAIRKGGVKVCPNESSGNYRYRTTPNGNCPRRRNILEDSDATGPTRRAEPELALRNITSESGHIVTVPYSAGNEEHLKLLEVGQQVWTHNEEGEGKFEKIVSSVDM